MMLKHYSPKTPTVLVPNVIDAVDYHKDKKIGILVFDSKINNPLVVHQEVLSTTSNLEEAASNLYAAMHRLDKLNLDIIITEQFPENNLGRAINDRLKRASQK
jgi:L-threonylcarbamoyladenylate synthase